MNAKREFSDEELTAYLDGEADAANVAALEAQLSMDPALASRLDQLRLPIDAMRTAFDGMLQNAPNVELAPEPKPALRLLPLAASLIVGVALGASLMLRPTPDAPGWMDYVASYQALYVTATLDTVDVPKVQQDAQLQALSEVLGRDVTNAAKFSGVAFKRGQVLGFKGRPLVQLAYLSPEGEPLALCIIRSDKAAQVIKETELEGMRAAHWSDGEFAYLLIGGSDPEAVATLAADFEANL